MLFNLNISSHSSDLIVFVWKIDGFAPETVYFATAHFILSSTFTCWERTKGAANPNVIYFVDTHVPQEKSNILAEKWQGIYICLISELINTNKRFYCSRLRATSVSHILEHKFRRRVDTVRFPFFFCFVLFFAFTILNIATTCSACCAVGWHTQTHTHTQSHQTYIYIYVVKRRWQSNFQWTYERRVSRCFSHTPFKL